MLKIKVSLHETKEKLPKEVSDFFLKLKEKHSAELGKGMLIEALNIRVNMHLEYAVIESQTSSYDQSKHWLEQ